MSAKFPEKLEPLFEFGTWDYKVLVGGRGGTKSWGMARALLIEGARRKLRILCARETMKSIADSVHKLLSDQITELGLQAHYTVEKACIIGGNGTEFTFAGLAHNIDNIKSLESYDVCWVEEAANVSKDSWDKLIPTIRKDGSEIWVSFNPDLATDDTYRRFVTSPSPRAKVVWVSWEDNPWLPDKLAREIKELRETNPDDYAHIYGGATKSTVEGAVYRAEIVAAEKAGRICKVPYVATHAVDTFWDLGYGDMVSIWFAQAVGFEYRIIDYFQDSKRALDYYLQALQGRGYTYGTCVLPWDGGAKSLGSGMSIEELMRAKGFKTRVLPQWRVADGINAARTVFPQLYFDGEKCADGLSGLRRYQWGPMPASGVQKREPLHDEASHPADALRALAVFLKAPAPAKEKPKVPARPTYRHEYSPFG